MRWYARFYTQDEPMLMTLMNLWLRFKAWLQGVPPPWEEEYLDAQEQATGTDVRKKRTMRVSQASVADEMDDYGTAVQPDDDDDDVAASSGGTDGAVADARTDMLIKRILSSLGLLGTLITWALFAWCVRRHCCADTSARLSQHAGLTLPSLGAGSRSRMGSSSTTHWALRRRTSSRARGASAMAWIRRRSGAPSLRRC